MGGHAADARVFRLCFARGGAALREMRERLAKVWDEEDEEEDEEDEEGT